MHCQGWHACMLAWRRAQPVCAMVIRVGCLSSACSAVSSTCFPSVHIVTIASRLAVPINASPANLRLPRFYGTSKHPPATLMPFTLPPNLSKEELTLVVRDALQQLHDCGGAQAVLSALGSTLSAVTTPSASPAKPDKPLAKWQRAVKLISEFPDPFLARGVHRLAIERCVRHRWDPDIENWRIDDGALLRDLHKHHT